MDYWGVKMIGGDYMTGIIFFIINVYINVIFFLLRP